MKFYGTPNMLVKTKAKRPFTGIIYMKPLFRFDENGEFETEDKELIKKLKKRFKYDEVNKAPKVDKKTYKCKKCDFETDNKGVLLAHYRTHKAVK